MRTPRLAAVTAALIATGLLAGCSASGSDGDAMPGVGSPAPHGTDVPIGDWPAAAGEDAYAPEYSQASPESGALSTAVTDRSIARTASLQLEVADVRAAAALATELAEQLGGSAQSQAVYLDEGTAPSAELSLRVPADSLDTAVAGLADLGTLRHEQRTADDLTDIHVDTGARVAALTASVERLTALLDAATSTADLIEAESALAARQGELDGLRAQLEALDAQVEQAQLWVSLHEPGTLPGGAPQSFWGAITAGFASIGTALTAVVLALGFALPWLVLAAIVAVVVGFLVRSRRRRARSRKTAENALTPKPAESVAEADNP